MTDRSLEGKTAFVSGSGQNIGRAVAIRLAEMGCNVVINGSSNIGAVEETAAALEAAGAKALIAMGDMGRPDAIRNIAEIALSRFGRVDVLVNNAARRPHKPFLDMTENDWHGVIDVALTAVFRTSQAFLPGMIDAGWGRIINFAGMKAIKGYNEGAPISAAKHGVWGLGKALSAEFAPRGITINTVSPGQIRKDTETEDDPTRAARIPAGFMGLTGDIAAMVGYLASPEARFVTGQMIAVNGGETT